MGDFQCLDSVLIMGGSSTEILKKQLSAIDPLERHQVAGILAEREKFQETLDSLRANVNQSEAMLSYNRVKSQLEGRDLGNNEIVELVHTLTELVKSANFESQDLPPMNELSEKHIGVILAGRRASGLLAELLNKSPASASAASNSTGSPK